MRLAASLLLVSTLLSLSACASPRADAPEDLVVLSYNIHHGQGQDGVFDLPRLAAVILASGADLVALQEVDVRTARAGGVDQAAELGRLTGMEVAFAEAMPYDGGSYGEAVLSRLPILERQVLALAASPEHEPRAAALVVVHPVGWSQSLAFVGTHLDHTDDGHDRLQQMESLRQQLSHRKMPLLLAGDFNCGPDSPPMRLLFQSGWLAADGEQAPTFPAQAPERKIDWILQAPGSGLHLSAATVLMAPVASDHAPLRAQLRFAHP